MSEIKLLPCPFCGGEAKMCDTGIEPSYYWIYCKECGCKQPSSIHREAVINAWNTRKPMQEIVDRLEDYSMWKELLIYDLTHREREIISKAIEIVKEVGGMND